MDVFAVLSLFGAMAVTTAMPGPILLVTFCRSAAEGLSAGLWLMMGTALSDVLMCALAMAILAGLVSVSEDALSAVRYVSAGVLAMIAIGALWPPATMNEVPLQRRGSNVVTGMALGLTSPFNLVFLIALMPQFVEVRRIDLATAAVVTGTIVAAACLVQLCAAISGAASLRFGAGCTRWTGRVCGVILICFAAMAIVTPIPSV